jgi:hypothetical protein
VLEGAEGLGTGILLGLDQVHIPPSQGLLEINPRYYLILPWLLGGDLRIAMANVLHRHSLGTSAADLQRNFYLSALLDYQRSLSLSWNRTVSSFQGCH